MTKKQLNDLVVSLGSCISKDTIKIINSLVADLYPDRDLKLSWHNSKGYIFIRRASARS